MKRKKLLFGLLLLAFVGSVLSASGATDELADLFPNVVSVNIVCSYPVEGTKFPRSLAATTFYASLGVAGCGDYTTVKAACELGIDGGMIHSELVTIPLTSGIGSVTVSKAVTLSSRSVGSHTFTSMAEFRGYTNGGSFDVLGTDSETINWYIDPPVVDPPEFSPQFSITTPAYNYAPFNFTASGTSYTAGWTVQDGDDLQLSSMILYVDGVTNQTWANCAVTSYTQTLTIDVIKIYNLTVWGQDGDGHTGKATRFLNATGATGGAAGVISLSAPISSFLNSAPTFSILSADSNGNHNLTGDINGLEFEYNYTDSLSNQVINTNYNHSISLDTNYRARSVTVSYDGVEKAVDDDYYDDTGNYTDGDWESTKTEDSGTWDWSFNADLGERINNVGYFDFYEDTDDLRNYFTSLAANLHINGDDHFYVEFNCTSVDSFANFEAFGIAIGLDDAPLRYAHIAYCPGAGVLRMGVRDTYWVSYDETGNWLSSQTVTCTLTNGTFYQFRITADFDAGGNEWIAYQFRWANGTLKTYRNSSADATNYLDKNTFYNVVFGLDNANGVNSHDARIDYFMTGDLDLALWSTTTASAAGLSYATTSLPVASYGTDVWVNFTSSLHCRINATITILTNCTYKIIYSSSAATSQTDSWTMTSLEWGQISEGSFTVSFILFDDGGASANSSFAFYKDLTPPTAIITSPFTYTVKNYTLSTIPQFNYVLDIGPGSGGFLIYELMLNESESHNSKRVVWGLLEDRPDNFPCIGERIVETAGVYNVSLTAKDAAGNEATDLVQFIIEEEKTCVFSFTSLSGSTVDYKRYLNMYVDDQLQLDEEVTTTKDHLKLAIYDQFNNLVYTNLSYPFAVASSIQLDLRDFTFTNQEAVGCDLKIYQVEGTELWFSIGSLGTRTVYLYDGSYSVNVYPAKGNKNDDTLWVANSFSFTVSATQTSKKIKPDTKEDLWFGFKINWDRLDEGIERVLRAIQSLWFWLAVMGVLLAIVLLVFYRRRKEKAKKGLSFEEQVTARLARIERQLKIIEGGE